MFMKLWKQEWRSTRGILGLLCLIILVSGAAIGGGGFYMAWSADQRLAGNDSLLTVLMSLLLVAAIAAACVCFAGGVFYYIWRFYHSRFTDEGYLTFTLPVTTHQNLLSSIVNTICSCLLIGLAALGAFLIALGLLILAYNREINWAEVFYVIRSCWSSAADVLMDNWRELLLFGGFGVATGISQLIVLMLSVTVGSIIARKHKILAAVVVYWVVGLTQSLLFSLAMIRGAMDTDASAVLWYPMLLEVVTAVAGYFLMYWLINKKLNLN